MLVLPVATTSWEQIEIRLPYTIISIEVQPRIEEYWSTRQDHRTNKTSLDSATRRDIDRRWARYLQEFGYDYAPVRAAKVG